MAKQTGPRTAVGKLNSSRNALKKGIYSNALLPNEDPQALEALADDLGRRFGVQDAAGEILVNRLLQATLQSNRLQIAQANLIRAKMHTMEVRRAFCVQVGIDVLAATELPNWYFEEDDTERQAALEMTKVWAEAKILRENFSTDLILRARKEFPSLWRFLMGPDGSAIQKVHATLGERIATLYKHPSPLSNLQELINELEKKHQHALLYAKNAERYEAVINGLRAKAVLDVYSDPNWSRADAATHKRTNELVGSLLGLQRENSKLQPLEVIESSDVTKTLENQEEAAKI